MKNRLNIFIAFILLILSAGPAWGNDMPGQDDLRKPKIFFKEKTFKANPILEGTPFEHTFNVYNRGDAVLSIQKVKPG